MVKRYKLPVRKQSTRFVMYNMITITSTAVWYIGMLLEEKIQETFIRRNIFFLLFFKMYLDEKMGVSRKLLWSLFHNIDIDTDQSIMLYVLNFHSDVCWLFPNKIGKNDISLAMSWISGQSRMKEKGTWVELTVLVTHKRYKSIHPNYNQHL